MHVDENGHRAVRSAFDLDTIIVATPFEFDSAARRGRHVREWT
jgi:hypothetical protein